MPEILLAPKERQALKAHAHGLKPVVLLGNSGLSRAVIREIDRALLAQSIGKLLVLFRPAPEPAADAATATSKAAPVRSRTSVKSAQHDPRQSRPGKPSAPKRTTPDRREAERVNRGTPARLEPGAAKRAAGKHNVVRRSGGRAR